MLTKNMPPASHQPCNPSGASSPSGTAFGEAQSYLQLFDHEWPRSKQRIIADKGSLFSTDDPRTHVYKVMSGTVCLYRTLKDGRRQVFDFAFSGDIIGLGYRRLELCDAQAVGVTHVSCLPVQMLMAAAKIDSRIALGVYEALSHELVAAQEHLMCLGHRGATERVATFLVILSRRNAMRGLPHDIINLSMSRIDIADFLGITIETVSRTLSKLKAQGLIVIDKITTLRLKSLSGLVALAAGGARL